MSGLRKRTSSAAQYARFLGITYEKMKRLGGEKRLRAMSPDARAILIGPGHYGNSKGMIAGGLRSRGMLPCVAGRESAAHIVGSEPPCQS